MWRVQDSPVVFVEDPGPCGGFETQCSPVVFVEDPGPCGGFETHL